MILMAHAADRYRGQTGQAHPAFGDGTLSSAVASQKKAPDASVDTSPYGDCLIDALTEILNFRSAYPAAQVTHRGTAGS